MKKMKEGLRQNPAAYRKGILTQWKTGEVKLWLARTLLQLRQKDPAFFLEAEYLAIEAQGKKKSHFVAFMRKLGNKSLFVAIPRLLAETEIGKKIRNFR